MAYFQWSCSLLMMFLVPFLAMLVVLFAGIDAPPTDFGSGSMFDAIATRYDMVNRVLAVGMDIGWRQRMVKAIHESVQDLERPRLLDVATGTADVAILLAKEIPSATVVGIDPSNNMLNVGRDKLRRGGMQSTIDLQVADAQEDLSTLFDPNSFDAATMAFGIRNVPDRKKALCEINRVLKEGSRFAILEFSEPDSSFGVLGAVARLFIRYVVPVLGAVLSGAPREYWHLQKSISDFPSPAEFVKILESVDCSASAGGSFEVEELIQMNHGSVQLYVAKVTRS